MLFRFQHSCPPEISGLTKLTNLENFKSNLGPYYMGSSQVAPGVPVEDKEVAVYSDLTTSFTVLLAIFFPSVTGGVLLELMFVVGNKMRIRGLYNLIFLIHLFSCNFC